MFCLESYQLSAVNSTEFSSILRGLDFKTVNFGGNCKIVYIVGNEEGGRILLFWC